MWLKTAEWLTVVDSNVVEFGRIYCKCGTMWSKAVWKTAVWKSAVWLNVVEYSVNVVDSSVVDSSVVDCGRMQYG